MLTMGFFCTRIVAHSNAGCSFYEHICRQLVPCMSLSVFEPTGQRLVAVLQKPTV